MDWKKIKHFKPAEFYCKCCGKEEMQQDFMEKLDELRDDCGVPFVVLSGYRCPAHDKAVKGKGNHPTGRAVDIACAGSEKRYDILWNGIGVFQRIGIGRTFVHLDDCDDKPQDVLWLY